MLAESFPTESDASFGVLKGLNEDLAPVSVLLGNGLKPSEADVIVFSAIHSSVVCMLHFVICIPSYSPYYSTYDS